uniref:RNA-directed DNA polymerase, eukaryota, reverse transcriptase zinc-binding domain protein n=1 Tax=Tanacetum cinerariifolium TaxID=118510 RepID=A0A699J6N8_TANCI|nr:RNA-directed DNA polymerase, eukaryota, reverse transcriptase zinc-binding domain protein [Tanacetum cinerariifolium]
MSRVKEWNEVVDKVVSRLSKWEMKTLSIRGRKKATWIKWSNVLADKAKGGLGVFSLYAINRGLMIKWLWRFYVQNTSLWVRVVKAIHGEDGKVGQNISSRSYSCWLNIVKEVSVLQAKGVDVMKYVRLKLGNGESTSFWKDKWINDGVLKDVFPRLYALEMCKKVYVKLEVERFELGNIFSSQGKGVRNRCSWTSCQIWLGRLVLCLCRIGISGLWKDLGISR